MEDTGILNIFLPEFTVCRNCIQSDIRGFHEFDVLDHLFYATDGAPKDIVLRLAALFHDIGKPKAKKVESSPSGDLYTFYNHENYSSEIAEKVLVRLKFPNTIVDDVSHLVKQHMFHYESTWSDAAVRRFIIRVKPEYIEKLFDLRLADVYGMHNVSVRIHDSETGKNLLELKDRIEKVQMANNALSLKDLKVTGKDLMDLGIPSGKKLGQILNSLLETVLDDPAQNQKDTLLTIAKNLNAIS